MTSQVVSSGFLRLGLHHPLIIFDGRPRPGTRWWPWWKLSILPGELGETVGKANQWKRLIIEKKWRWSYFHEWASKNDPIVFWSQFFWAWFKDMWKFWFPYEWMVFVATMCICIYKGTLINTGLLLRACL